MSYSKFSNAVNDHMKWCDKNNVNYKNSDQYYYDVRDKWIEEGRIK